MCFRETLDPRHAVTCVLCNGDGADVAPGGGGRHRARPTDSCSPRWRVETTRVADGRADLSGERGDHAHGEWPLAGVPDSPCPIEPLRCDPQDVLNLRCRRPPSGRQIKVPPTGGKGGALPKPCAHNRLAHAARSSGLKAVPLGHDLSYELSGGMGRGANNGAGIFPGGPLVLISEPQHLPLDRREV
jgi:hypothetical protein